MINTYVKKSCSWASVVLGAIPDTYMLQVSIDNVDSYDTDVDDKWSHGRCNKEIARPFSPALRRLNSTP